MRAKSSVSAILAIVVSFTDWVTGCDVHLYESRVAHELEYRVVRSAVAADGDYELRAPERNSWSCAQCLKLNSGTMSVTR